MRAEAHCIFASVGAATLLLAACTTPGPRREVPSFVAPLDGSRLAGLERTRQLVVVVSGSATATDAALYALERTTSWRVVRGPIAATVGRNGFAPPGEKREGDGRTPSGLYDIELAFGYAPTAVTALPYREATTDDLWVDDVASDQYNTWVKAPTTAASYERMRRDDDLYKVGLVIGYNTSPVVKGAGSAIFLHVWRGPGRPTAGCVAVSEPDVGALLAWLDTTKSPRIVMGTEDFVRALLGG